jgi:hypothetical protein
VGKNFGKSNLDFAIAAYKTGYAPNAAPWMHLRLDRRDYSNVRPPPENHLSLLRLLPPGSVAIAANISESANLR